MVSINVDNRIKKYIKNDELLLPRARGYLDAMLELAFINQAEYDGYIRYWYEGNNKHMVYEK